MPNKSPEPTWTNAVQFTQGRWDLPRHGSHVAQLFSLGHFARHEIIICGVLCLGLDLRLTLFGIFLSSRGCVPDGFALFAVEAHYPAVWLFNHGVHFTFTLILAVGLAVVVWTGIVYLILRLFKKLFRKNDPVA